MKIERRKNANVPFSSASPQARALPSKGPLLRAALSGLNYLWVQKPIDLHGKFLDLNHQKENVQKISALFKGDLHVYVSMFLDALPPDRLNNVMQMHQQHPLDFQEKMLKAFQEGPLAIKTIITHFASGHENTL